MTYCLAMRLDDGLVFVSDTRTNAGVDNISTYRKLHVLRPAPDRVFVLQSAGNLATTHEVLDRIGRDLANTAGDDAGPRSLATVEHLFEAALYVGELSREVAANHRDALAAVGADGTSTFILGGQIGGAPPDLMHIYPEGNYVRVSDDRPFLQIGETKYGKFILEFAVTPALDLVAAAKVGVASMMSTARANLSVGPPYDVGIYANGSFDVTEVRLDADSPILARLQRLWQSTLLRALAELPTVSSREVGDDLEPG